MWQHISERPEFIPQLASWFHTEWGFYNPKRTIEIRCKELEARNNQRILPTTMVSTMGDELLATYSLDISDLPIRPHLSPWLASVYVNPQHRNKGLGTLLVKKSLEHAKALGFDTLYLFTSNRAHWYGSMGWQFMEEAEYPPKEVITIMKYHQK